MKSLTPGAPVAAALTGEIPYPKANEEVVGGHAVLAVGYDNGKKIKQAGGQETTGAFLIRNSWGTQGGTTSAAGPSCS